MCMCTRTHVRARMLESRRATLSLSLSLSLSLARSLARSRALSLSRISRTRSLLAPVARTRASVTPFAAPAGCCKCATLEGCAVGKAPVCARTRMCARERARASESAGTRERVGASERRASVRPLPAAPQHFDQGTSCGTASSSVHADPPRRPTTCAAALTDGRLASCRTVPPHFARSRSPPAGGGRNALV